MRSRRRKIPTIGYLGPTTPAVESQRITAFVQRLREIGWIEGRTIAIEYPWAEGRSERFIEIAAEFVRLNVDVIATYAPRAQMTKLGEKVPTRVACLPDGGLGGLGVRAPLQPRYTHRLVVLPGGPGEPTKAERCRDALGLLQSTILINLAK